VTTRDGLSMTVGSPDIAAWGAPVSVRRGFGVAWIDSVCLGLAISLIVGLLYTFVLMGPAQLNPHNIAWLIGDPAMY
jgi:hypothetical protein